MISKFFIDRPIFATVLSVVITLTGAIALLYLPLAQYPRITPPSVSVSITYPGASAQVVADTVAAPIEQQVTGVPGMLYMSSQMGNDGTYTLSVTFDVGVDLKTALVMVQNRVALAMPLLPTPVQNQGITIRKKTPDILCMVNFISAHRVTTTGGQVITGKFKGEDEEAIALLDADGKERRIPLEDIKEDAPLFSDIFLSNFALINVKDELLRVYGVSDINVMGQRDYSVRIWLDPQQLASRNMTAIDVANAVRDQNLPAVAGQVGQPPMAGGPSFQLPLDTLGRLSDPEQFANIIVKAVPSQPRTSAIASAAPSPGSGTLGSGMLGTLAPTNGAGLNGGLAGGLAGGLNAADLSADADSTTDTSNPDTTTGGANSGGGGTSGGGADSSGGGTTGGGASLTAMFKPPTFAMPLANPTKAKKRGPRKMQKVGAMPTSVGVVRLKDVARVEMGALNYNMSCSFDGGPSVGLSVYQLPGTNALDVADRVRAKMRELKKRFPDGLDYTIAYDTTPFIRESIGEVFHTLRDAVILVAIVVLFFLQDWRAMVLPMIDVPVSLIGTFAVMAAMGYSLNNISLFGLVLAIGIVVDDAIVVLENIERQMAKGYDIRTATIKAMEEISGPILAITLVLCAVFVPCAFISGITGRFFTQFAVTIAASTVISAVNALTMTPSRALVIFKSKEGHGHERRREALPWWIFGLLGFVTLTQGPKLLTGLGWGTPTDAESDVPMSFWQSWGSTALLFAPGLLAGLVGGWFIIRPVNLVLGAVFRGFNRGFDKMTAVYGWTIGMFLRLSVIVLLAYGGLVFLTYYVFQTSPRGFVPQQDMGRLIVNVQLPDSASLARTREAVAKIDSIIRKTPGVAHTIGLYGISFVEQANASNFASLLVILDPFDKRQERSRRAEGIMSRLRKQWATQVKDARVIVLGSSPIPGLSVAGGFRMMVEDRGGLGLTTLQAQADSLVSAVKRDIGEGAEAATAKREAPAGAPGSAPAAPDAHGPHRPMLANVNTQFRSNTPQLYMDIDRIKVASLGVSLNDVNQTLEIYLGSLYVNSFNEFGRHWQVTLQADQAFRSHVDDINRLQVRNDKGQMVRLGTLVKVREKPGPIFVKRYNLYTAAPITGAILPRISSGEVIKEVDRISDETLPLSMKADWTELMFMQIREASTTGTVFSLAVVCVFLALSALYESWTLPLAVILVVPLCMFCSVIGVTSTNQSVNVFVQIGLVVLVGLACKNAILVVEFARELHAQGRPVFEATLEASRLRLRPILMTSFAFILGVVPLCVASGAGAEMRRSLGTAVFSGMLGVTAFGIFLTPVFFYVIQEIGKARLFAGATIQWVASSLFGGLLGAGTGYLLARLVGWHPLWAPVVGAALGILAVLGVRGVHQKLKAKG
jgi:multidrug efflux pump